MARWRSAAGRRQRAISDAAGRMRYSSPALFGGDRFRRGSWTSKCVPRCSAPR